LGGADIGMPGSDGLAMVKKGSWFARWALNKDFDQLKTADQLAEQIVGSLTGAPDGKTTEVNLHLLNRMTVPIWAAVYHAMENWMRRSFYADDRCIGCGFCESICPIGAVRLTDGQPRFDTSCVLCLRCVHQCPQEAIQIGRWTVNKFRWRGPKESYRPPRLRKIDRSTGIGRSPPVE
jgi:ferredoxin